MFDGDEADDVLVLELGHGAELALSGDLLASTHVSAEHLACHQLAAALQAVRPTSRYSTRSRRPYRAAQLRIRARKNRPRESPGMPPAPSRGESEPHLKHGSLGPTSRHPKRHSDQFIRFCTVHARGQQTDRHTDRNKREISCTPSTRCKRSHE